MRITKTSFTNRNRKDGEKYPDFLWSRLAPVDIRELRELMSYDELELDLLGDRKTALFVITSRQKKVF